MYIYESRIVSDGSASGSAAMLIQHTIQPAALRYTYMCVYIYPYLHVYLQIQHIMCGGSAPGSAAVFIQHTMQQAALMYTFMCVCVYV